MASSLLLHPPPLLNPKFNCSPRLLKPYSSPPLSSIRFFPSPNHPRPQIRLKFSGRSQLGFFVSATNNGGGSGGGGGGGDVPSESAAYSADVAEEETARGRSTMPERFRYLTKEAPDRPVRWPWAIAVVFLAYCWRTVLWELTNWKKAASAILNFFGYLSKLALALIFHFIGDPVTGMIRSIEFTLNLIRDIYFSIVGFAPVPELTRIILFTSTILAIAESTVPDSVNSQPYLLSFTGLLAFGAIVDIILEPFFYLFLSAMFIYSFFVKKRDIVSALLPCAAALAAVGEPWVRFVAIGSYLAVTIVHLSKSPNKDTEVPVQHRKLPLPLLLSALAIGIHVAAKWVRYRHLTWMIA